MLNKYAQLQTELRFWIRCRDQAQWIDRHPVDGAKLDALIAVLYRIPQDVVDAARSTVGFGAR